MARTCAVDGGRVPGDGAVRDGQAASVVEVAAAAVRPDRTAAARHVRLVAGDRRIGDRDGVAVVEDAAPAHGVLVVDGDVGDVVHHGGRVDHQGSEVADPAAALTVDEGVDVLLAAGDRQAAQGHGVAVGEEGAARLAAGDGGRPRS